MGLVTSYLPLASDLSSDFVRQVTRTIERSQVQAERSRVFNTTLWERFRAYDVSCKRAGEETRWIGPHAWVDLPWEGQKRVIYASESV
jgi:hypothetical protein